VRRALVLAALLGSTVMVLGGRAEAVNEDAYTSVLHTGHCLEAGGRIPAVYLESTSTRFDLELYAGQLDITNRVHPTPSTSGSYPTWFVLRRPAGVRVRRSTLCMQTNGNLVMRNDGTIVWSSHTAGSGHHNTALMRNDGALVVRSAPGKRVWSTHTTAVLMTVGDRLRPGTTLTNATSPFGHTHLIMRRSGNLQLYRDRVLVWQTSTHTPGSYLAVSSHYRLVVRSPGGSVLWRSAAVGRGAVLTVAQKGRITFDSVFGGRCWERPVSSLDCGVG
jgi:hypothetical protein